MRKIRILSEIPSDVDATSWYRGAMPLCEMQRDWPDVELLDFAAWKWPTMERADVVFFQRPFTDQHVAMMNYAKKMKIPVWVDYDDDLLSVPHDNPTYATYGLPSVMANIAKLTGGADLVTVSTEPLLNTYKQYQKNIHVVPNALPARIANLRLGVSVPREKKILWRGGQTHERDLMSVHQALLKVGESHPDWKFEFMGYHPWWLVETMGDKGIYTGAMDIIDYHIHLWESRASISIVPLNDNVFNRSKSHIGWLETAWAGMVPIIPNLPDFEDKRGYVYKAVCTEKGQEVDASDFEEKLRAAIANHENHVSEGVEVQLAALAMPLKPQNKKRYDLIRGIL